MLISRTLGIDLHLNVINNSCIDNYLQLFSIYCYFYSLRGILLLYLCLALAISYGRVGFGEAVMTFTF